MKIKNRKRKLVFATNNVDKINELKPILQNILSKQINEDFEVVTFDDLDVNFEVEEGDTSLYINAAKKAKESYDELVMKNIIKKDDIVVAEDSGLFGSYTTYPGVVTKREIKRLGTEKMLDLFKQKNTIRGKVSDICNYTSIIAFYSEDVQLIAEAKEFGKILDKPLGNYNYPIDKYFNSVKRGPLGLITPANFSSTSFRKDATFFYDSKDIFNALNKK